MRLRGIFAGFDPAFRWLALIRGIGALGFALSIPFLSLYLHEELNIPLTQIGVMLAVSGLFGAAASPLGGAASDRYGRKKLLVSFLALRAVTFVVLTLLVWHRASFLVFSALWIINSLLGTATFPMMDATLVDVTPAERRDEAFGLLRVVANLGWALGPAIGGLMVVSGYHLLFLTTAAALIVSTAVARVKLQETWRPAPEVSRPNNFRAITGDPMLLRFLAVCLLLFMVRGQLIAPFSVHASSNVGLTKSQIGLLYFLNGALVAVMQLPITRIVSLFKPLRALTAAGLLYGVGYYMVGLARDQWGMIAAVVIITIAEMIEAPTASAYVSRLAPAGMTGIYMGAFSLVMHLGWTVGPLLGGILIDTMPRVAEAWGVIALLAGCASVGFFGMSLRSK